MLSAFSPEVERLIDRALEEDLGLGDVTTDILIPPELQGSGTIIAKAHGVLTGLPVALAVFRRVDPSIQGEALLEEGAPLEPGSRIADISGPLAGILKGERTALNLLQRLSGIATETSHYVAAVHGLPVRIIDTRKTTPGLRLLEKHAITVGGGYNHRKNLGDGILIKDNHIAALRRQGVGLAEVVRRARQRAPHTLRIEVEVTTVEEAREALAGGADIILLDNMS
ncbi:MAG: carboxylating nicotinate-nucleotide diphosphorylase, partial [Dehalococcoidia bacterium]|nr:carboxylating nicotinate-nucleotide diphosphorylase [Dehalococcoidia bacterium]